MPAHVGVKQYGFPLGPNQPNSRKYICFLLSLIQLIHSHVYKQLCIQFSGFGKAAVACLVAVLVAVSRMQKCGNLGWTTKESTLDRWLVLRTAGSVATLCGKHYFPQTLDCKRKTPCMGVLTGINFVYRGTAEVWVPIRRRTPSLRTDCA